jgi:hypothetical protein
MRASGHYVYKAEHVNTAVHRRRKYNIPGNISRRRGRPRVGAMLKSSSAALKLMEGMFRRG